jgi:hypothetical protein
MIIKSKKLIDGVYSLYFKNYDLNKLKDAHIMNKKIVEMHLLEIISKLNLNLINFDVWNSNLKNEDKNKIVFDWHEDSDEHIDTLLLMYFTNYKLNENTGGRIGFKYNDIKKFYNIKSYRCFLAKQDKLHFHKVENAKIDIEKRLCISISLSGWNNIKLYE